MTWYRRKADRYPGTRVRSNHVNGIQDAAARAFEMADAAALVVDYSSQIIMLNGCERTSATAIVAKKYPSGLVFLSASFIRTPSDLTAISEPLFSIPDEIVPVVTTMHVPFIFTFSGSAREISGDATLSSAGFQPLLRLNDQSYLDSDAYQYQGGLVAFDTTYFA